MKVLSLNFLTCAVKACKSSSASYPLHPKDAELVQDDLEINPDLLVNVLPRLDWAALSTTATELGFPALPAQPPTAEELLEGASSSSSSSPPPQPAAGEAGRDGQEGGPITYNKTMTDLHRLLMETQMMEGKLVCANCGHEYAVREGIANFLLPSHLV